MNQQFLYGATYNRFPPIVVPMMPSPVMTPLSMGYVPTMPQYLPQNMYMPMQQTAISYQVQYILTDASTSAVNYNDYNVKNFNLRKSYNEVNTEKKNRNIFCKENSQKCNRGVQEHHQQHQNQLTSSNDSLPKISGIPNTTQSEVTLQNSSLNVLEQKLPVEEETNLKNEQSLETNSTIEIHQQTERKKEFRPRAGQSLLADSISLIDSNQTLRRPTLLTLNKPKRSHHSKGIQAKRYPTTHHKYFRWNTKKEKSVHKIPTKDMATDAIQTSVTDYKTDGTQTDQFVWNGTPPNVLEGITILVSNLLKQAETMKPSGNEEDTKAKKTALNVGKSVSQIIISFTDVRRSTVDLESVKERKSGQENVEKDQEETDDQNVELQMKEYQKKEEPVVPTPMKAKQQKSEQEKRVQHKIVEKDNISKVEQEKRVQHKIVQKDNVSNVSDFDDVDSLVPEQLEKINQYEDKENTLRKEVEFLQTKDESVEQETSNSNDMEIKKENDLQTIEQRDMTSPISKEIKLNNRYNKGIRGHCPLNLVEECGHCNCGRCHYFPNCHLTNMCRIARCCNGLHHNCAFHQCWICNQ